ncbi:magnesium transporter [Pararhizobium sp. IMCC21322]|uniref:magnesium transporter n=1 Tax=Pararhizobium sp. IMCC21322 TaxID=3067903 RepID=UPI00274213A9|nr:magnesium transporter [Pararhizobium sp. IMCC21322]
MIHDPETGGMATIFVDAVQLAIEGSDKALARQLTADLHEADLADLIEALPAPDRSRLIALLGSDFDFTALTELDEGVRLSLLENLPVDTVAEGLSELDSDDAVFILEDLTAEDQAEILDQLPALERVVLQRSLNYPEESAGRRMQTEYIAVPPFWTVGQAIDYMRDTEDLPESFYELFVVDPTYRLLGTVALDRLLRTKRPVSVSDIMGETAHTVKAEEDQEEVARTFERYNLVSAAVVDESERLVGVLTIDDIVDVIQEEHEEDFKRMAGVGDEEISDNVFNAVRSRFIWLMVNLGTAVLASVIIGLFDATIQQMVALAVLMPIVASMGGNAATQTMTVAVRALATRELDSYNVRRIILRESTVGLINGFLFAIVIGLVTAMWFGNAALSIIIALAMIINMFSAGLAGILIPIVLDKLKVDPAIASGVFVTTVTDVVGFFAFLGLAAWWFGI